jgi:hypothetical protein
VYQVQALADTATQGISASDLFWIDKVTYSPASLRNTPICEYSLAVKGASVLLASVHNPWHDYFIRGLDAEFQKVAIATLNAQADFQSQVFGACAQIGMGNIYFSQVRATADHPKSIRFYSRLLGNLGVIFERKFLSIEKTPQDLDIPNWMALEQADYVDQEAMLAYFSAEDFTVNNLGEGVYGWMMRLEKTQAGLQKTQAGLQKTQAGLQKTQAGLEKPQAGLEKTQAGLHKTQAGLEKTQGEVRIPGSAGKTWFLTVFVESAENHNPLKRAANELPDSSIVPDLYVKTNCAFTVYANGKLLAEEEAPAEPVKIEDVLLDKGINRLLIVCWAGVDDIRLNAWFRSKYGDPVGGLRYLLTLD